MLRLKYDARCTACGRVMEAGTPYTYRTLDNGDTQTYHAVCPEPEPGELAGGTSPATPMPIRPPSRSASRSPTLTCSSSRRPAQLQAGPADHAELSGQRLQQQRGGVRRWLAGRRREAVAVMALSVEQRQLLESRPLAAALAAPLARPAECEVAGVAHAALTPGSRTILARRPDPCGASHHRGLVRASNAYPGQRGRARVTRRRMPSRARRPR